MHFSTSKKCKMSPRKRGNQTGHSTGECLFFAPLNLEHEPQSRLEPHFDRYKFVLTQKRDLFAPGTDFRHSDALRCQMIFLR
jgi:hypothetical protein